LLGAFYQGHEHDTSKRRTLSQTPAFSTGARGLSVDDPQLDPGTQAIDPSRALLGESGGTECGDKKVEALNEAFDAVRAAMTAGDRELTA
jgi:hypothetical protein